MTSQKDSKGAVAQSLRILSGLAMVGACFGLAAAGIAEGGPDRRAQELAALAAWDGSLETAGHRLAVGNVGLCRRLVWRAGITLHDLSQYGPESRAAAIRAFGVGARPSVLALAEGGPAARAGVEVGDVLLSADGAAVAGTQPAARASAHAMEAAAAILDAAFGDGEAVLEVQRGDARLRLPVRAERGCRSRFQLEASGESNAGADGEWVRVTTQLTRSVRNADEFAAIVAHEFAHNILGHRGRSALSALFNHRAVRAQEIEADRLSVWLLDGAGYDPEGAVTFWRRFGPAERALLAGPTHPGWRRRVRIIEAEIVAMRRLKRTDPGATPPFLSLMWTGTSAPRPQDRQR